MGFKTVNLPCFVIKENLWKEKLSYFQSVYSDWNNVMFKDGEWIYKCRIAVLCFDLFPNYNKSATWSTSESLYNNSTTECHKHGLCFLKHQEYHIMRFLEFTPLPTLIFHSLEKALRNFFYLLAKYSSSFLEFFFFLSSSPVIVDLFAG